jgi:hypothetical protein
MSDEARKIVEMIERLPEEDQLLVIAFVDKLFAEQELAKSKSTNHDPPDQ